MVCMDRRFKEKNLSPCWELNPGYPVHGQSLYWLASFSVTNTSYRKFYYISYPSCINNTNNPTLDFIYLNYTHAHTHISNAATGTCKS
jgi:hypothetical protein